MQLELFISAASLLGAVLLLYTFRVACTDFVYLALKRWRYSSFIMLCVGIGLFAGMYNSHFSGMFGNYRAAILQPAEDTLLARINSCKQFVTAKLEHKPGYEEPRPPLAHILKIGARSYWDSCAHTFGTQYWNYDISINGENGGHVLCRAYRQNDYRSGNVENWCSTVFAEGHKI